MTAKIKLITLNIEGDKHLDKVLSFLRQERADVICLQEIFAQDLPCFEAELGMLGHFAMMSRVVRENRYQISPRGEWGNAIFTKLAHQPPELHYYAGDGSGPVFTGPNSVDRVLMVMEVEVGGISGGQKLDLGNSPGFSQKFMVATTHFTWSPQGEPSDEQRRDCKSLLRILTDLNVTDRFGENAAKMILCGDFNAPRGGEIFGMFEQFFYDALPVSVTTTLDPDLHYAGPLELVVDTIFYTSPYQVQSVRVVGGVSDHQAVVGEISLKEKQ
jgi:exonuclease III